MNTFGLAIFCVAIAAASAGWYAPSGIIKTHGGDALVAGPSGSISTSNGNGWVGQGAWGGYGAHGYAAPAWNGAWNGAHGAWNVAPVAWTGVWNGAQAYAGHEGQWVPEYSEKHYDDGSYRPEHQYGSHDW